MLLEVIEVTTANEELIVVAETGFGIVKGVWKDADPAWPVLPGKRIAVKVEIPEDLEWGRSIAPVPCKGWVLKTTAEQTRICGILESCWEDSDGYLGVVVRVGPSVFELRTTEAYASQRKQPGMTMPRLSRLDRYAHLFNPDVLDWLRANVAESEIVEITVGATGRAVAIGARVCLKTKSLLRFWDEHL